MRGRREEEEGGEGREGKEERKEGLIDSRRKERGREEEEKNKRKKSKEMEKKVGRRRRKEKKGEKEKKEGGEGRKGRGGGDQLDILEGEALPIHRALVVGSDFCINGDTRKHTLGENSSALAHSSKTPPQPGPPLSPQPSHQGSAVHQKWGLTRASPLTTAVEGAPPRLYALSTREGAEPLRNRGWSAVSARAAWRTPRLPYRVRGTVPSSPLQVRYQSWGSGTLREKRQKNCMGSAALPRPAPAVVGQGQLDSVPAVVVGLQGTELPREPAAIFSCGSLPPYSQPRGGPGGESGEERGEAT
ncbi:hypothetical protein P7K49_036627 [Saguinus oedipus]|uniref:Uncharacterized protein n=1 Tax=Saguinus oedipus TaxID=9490 RepID=A0ABQ9TMA9_SAGOE|nr:hypothetical protein P7K49_036627 [Saguinus oedipus]